MLPGPSKVALGLRSRPAEAAAPQQAVCSHWRRLELLSAGLMCRHEAGRDALPGLQKCVKQWPKTTKNSPKGHDFTYCSGPGRKRFTQCLCLPLLCLVLGGVRGLISAERIEAKPAPKRGLEIQGSLPGVEGIAVQKASFLKWSLATVGLSGKRPKKLQNEPTSQLFCILLGSSWSFSFVDNVCAFFFLLCVAFFWHLDP